MMKLPQPDFCVLVCPPDEGHESLPDLLAHPSLSRSGSSSKLEDLTNEQNVYVPRNAIKPDVYALLLAWTVNEKCREQDSGSVRKTEFYSSGDMEAPMPPPKKFYLTSWRHFVLRIMEIKTAANDLPCEVDTRTRI
jgi:hypothetical protein